MFRDVSKVARTGATDQSPKEPVKPIPGDALKPQGNACETLTPEVYRRRLEEQKKYYEPKPGTRSMDNGLQDPPTMPPVVTICPKTHAIPERTAEGHFFFEDFPEFKPNLSPQQVIQAGSFGGTYFRDISSAVT